MLNFTAIDLQLYKIFKITRVSFFQTHCSYIRLHTNTACSQQILVVFQTLSSCTTDDRSDCPPLSRHQLGKMQQLFLLLTTPLCLLNAWIKPLKPASLALFTRLAV